jgi:hypothetical protein
MVRPSLPLPRFWRLNSSLLSLQLPLVKIFLDASVFFPLLVEEVEHARSNVMEQDQHVRLALGEKMPNASTTKYLHVVGLIDVLVSDRINLVEVTLVLLVLLMFRTPEDLGLGLHPHLRMHLGLGRLVLQLKGGQWVPRRVEPRMLLHSRTNNRRRVLMALVL